MKRNRHRLWLAPITFLVLSAGFQPAAAGDPSCTDPAVPLAALLMPPPKHDSAQTRAELQELLRIQESRTPDQVTHAREDDRRTVESFLGGIGVKVEQLSPAANHFFDCIADAVEHAVREAKLTFMRTRPYRLPDNKLHTLKKLSDRDSSSYPSGHATYGTVVGLVLAEMLPEKKEEIYKRIQNYGHSRLVSGAHFRSDVYAGKVAGAAIAASLLSKQNFRNEFDEVKAELRKTIGLAS
jgi:acid phosphatase (class A)